MTTTCDPAYFYSKGATFADYFYRPERYVQEHFKDSYKNSPILSRLVAVPLAALSGFLKPFLFPIWSLIGVIAMPIIATIQAIRGDEDTGGWLAAWSFTLLGTGTVLTFMAVSAFYLPMIYSAGIFMTAMTISISIHVYHACHDPNNN